MAARCLRATGVAQRHSMWRAQLEGKQRDKSKQHVLTKGVFVSICGAKIWEKVTKTGSSVFCFRPCKQQCQCRPSRGGDALGIAFTACRASGFLPTAVRSLSGD